MRKLLSVIVSLMTAMAFAQQPVESTSNESDPMLRIGKSYLGTRYVANTLDRNEVEQLVQYLAKIYVDKLMGRPVPEYFDQLKLNGPGLSEKAFK